MYSLLIVLVCATLCATDTCYIDPVNGEWILAHCAGDHWFETDGLRHSVTTEDIANMRSVACFAKENNIGLDLHVGNDTLISLNQRHTANFCDEAPLRNH